MTTSVYAATPSSQPNNPLQRVLFFFFCCHANDWRNSFRGVSSESDNVVVRCISETGPAQETAASNAMQYNAMQYTAIYVRKCNRRVFLTTTCLCYHCFSFLFAYLLIFIISRFRSPPVTSTEAFIKFLVDHKMWIP